MRLYTNKFSRGTRPRWLLEEAGLPYEAVEVDMRGGGHKAPEYLALHPHGQVPVLVVDGKPIFESAAITLWLADQAPGLAPAVGTLERAAYYQWCFWAMATLEPAVIQIAGEQRKAEGERDAAALAASTAKYHECLRVLGNALGSDEWLVANTFSAADVLVISVLAWAGSMKLNVGFPAIEAYVNRGKARPAFARARA